MYMVGSKSYCISIGLKIVTFHLLKKNYNYERSNFRSFINRSISISSHQRSTQGSNYKKLIC